MSHRGAGESTTRKDKLSINAQAKLNLLVRM
jgi:hypothetical protein